MDDNHNPYKLKKGDKALLDKSEVYILDFSPYGLFTTVSPTKKLEDSYKVMTVRLKKITTFEK